jgi:hypothetical protein
LGGIVRVDKFARCYLLSVFFLAGFLTAAGVDPARAYLGEYSADYVSVSGGQKVQGTLSVSDKNMRINRGRVAIITRENKGVIWLLMLDTHVYMEMPLNAQYLLYGSDEVAGEVTRELVDTEVIDGMVTDKYRITVNLGGRNETVYTWIPPCGTYPVKTAGTTGAWDIQFGNISMAAQPESLFEIPAGYSRFSADMLALPPDIGQLFPSE